MPRINRPIFIVGPGRSGTTLLRTLLSAHSRISIAPETHFMNRASVNGLRDGRPGDFEAFWQAYTSWVRFKDLGVDADRCYTLIMQHEHPTFENMFRAVLNAYGERTGKERIGEKSPSHVYYLAHLFSWFPDAQVLIAQRDPRAIIASQLKTQYVRAQLTPLSVRHGVIMGKRVHQIAFYAHDWRQIYGKIVPTWADDPRVYVVGYESLVQAPEDELRAICNFLEEQYEPSMLTTRSRHTVALPAATEDDPEFEEWRREHQEKALRPISSDSLGKWKDELSDVEIAMVEGHTAPVMQAFGYDASVPQSKRVIGRMLTKTLLTGESVETRARDAARNAWRRVQVARKS